MSSIDTGREVRAGKFPMKVPGCFVIDPCSFFWCWVCAQIELLVVHHDRRPESAVLLAMYALIFRRILAAVFALVPDVLGIATDPEIGFPVV